MAVLVLRPEPGATATAARARAMGLDAILAPLFEVRPLPWAGIDGGEPPQALMLTSANAVRQAGRALDHYRALPVYAVGTSTAEAARAAGFADVHAGPSDAAGLLGLMAGHGIGHAVHLCGREHRAVTHPGVTISRRIVYAADAVAALPETAIDALGSGAVALLHSPRAAALFAGLVADRGRVAIAAISPAAAAAAGPGWRAVATAATPDDAALLAAATGLCD